MNSESIYSVMLSKEYPIAGRDFPLLGFTYRVFENRDGTKILKDGGSVEVVDAGKVWIDEHGHPTRIVLWDKDGPELADLTEGQVKERIEEVLSR